MGISLEGYPIVALEWAYEKLVYFTSRTSKKVF